MGLIQSDPIKRLLLLNITKSLNLFCIGRQMEDEQTSLAIGMGFFVVEKSTSNIKKVFKFASIYFLNVVFVLVVNDLYEMFKELEKNR